jgi:hypothetical protein
MERTFARAPDEFGGAGEQYVRGIIAYCRCGGFTIN